MRGEFREQGVDARRSPGTGLFYKYGLVRTTSQGDSGRTGNMCRTGTLKCHYNVIYLNNVAFLTDPAAKKSTPVQLVIGMRAFQTYHGGCQLLWVIRVSIYGTNQQGWGRS